MRKFLLLLLVAAALPAAAHPGLGRETVGFLAGFTHPASGVDHLLAMLAVGFWSATATRRIWRTPLVFATVLLLGALLALGGLTFPAVEPMIAASVLLLGLMVMSRVQLPEPAASLMIASFALFHGAAHGDELGAGSALAGMVVATALILGIGLTLGYWLRTYNECWQRGVGGSIALAGLGLSLNLI